MSDLYYMITFVLTFVLFFLFIMTTKMFIMDYENYHGLDFINIDKNFTIIHTQTGHNIDHNSENTIYTQTVPYDCAEENGDGGTYKGAPKKRSIYCLSDLKYSSGFYNGRRFRSSD